MECQVLLSWKNKNNISKCRLLKLLPSMQRVKLMAVHSFFIRYVQTSKHGASDIYRVFTVRLSIGETLQNV